MPSERYELLKAEIPCIAKQVDAFPVDLQATVFQLLVEALLGQEIAVAAVDRSLDANPKVIDLGAAEQTDSGSRNYVTEILDYYTRYSMSGRNDMEVAAFAAYYFTQVAPPDKRVDAIGSEHYIDLCKITGRQLPKSAPTTLNNSKNRKGYLETKGTGVYALTDSGEHFVVHELIKGDEE